MHPGAGAIAAQSGNSGERWTAIRNANFAEQITDDADLASVHSALTAERAASAALGAPNHERQTQKAI